MGVLGPVFRTYDPERDRLVAVKVFRVDITPEQARVLAECLNRMAEIGLSEPGLVTPLKAGVQETVAYLAQEYVAAESLDVAMGHYAPSTIARAAPFVSQLAGAIDGARAAGVLHGALHPRDIFVTPDSAKATGFGVVPALEEVGLRGPVRRPYTAPERVGGTDWGPGADIFSLAAIAYELLTGKRPAGTGAEAARELRESPASSNFELEQLFEAALSEYPEDRPRTAQEFASALEVLGSGAGAGAGAVPRVPAPPPVLAEAGPDEPIAPGDKPGGTAAADHVVEPTTVFEDDDSAFEAWDSESQEPAVWPIGSETTDSAEALAPSSEEPPPEQGLADVASDPPAVVEEVSVPPAPAQPETPVDEESPDELAIWLTSVDSADTPRPPRRPESGEVDRLLSTPEASEALTESWDPDAPPPAPERPAPPQPRRPLFDTGRPVVMPVASGSTLAAAAVPKPPSDAGAEPGVIDSRWGNLLSDDRDIDQEIEAELAAEVPMKRTPTLPFALALILGILVAFVAGYGLGSRGPESAPAESVSAPPVPTAGTAAPPAPAAPDAPSDAEPVTPAAAEAAPDLVPVTESVAEAIPEPEPVTPDPAPAPPELVDAPGLVAEAPSADAPPPPPPAAVGRLLIRSNPPGAQVVVNDRAAGITPLAVGDLPYGDYMIRISRAGYRIELLSVSIAAGNPVAALDLALIESGDTPPPAPRAVPPAPSAVAAEMGTVMVNSRPGGADVYLDGRLVGATPLTLVDVRPGSHAVRLVRAGYREWTTTVDVTPGQELLVAASLEGTP